MIEIDRGTKDEIVEELIVHFSGKIDGSRKNIVCDCPECGGKGKMGIYIGKETERKKWFMTNCFKCQHRFDNLKELLYYIGRMDLYPEDTTDISTLTPYQIEDEKEDELDTTLEEVELPEGYKRKYYDSYLESRGFEDDGEDYDFFEVGRSTNFKFKDYVIFPIIDDGKVVGYVSRHKWSKKRIEKYNDKAKKEGKYRILRYRNSTENDFAKLLYNYDSIIEDETDTVVLVEGIFDVITMTRELNLYDNPHVAIIATFGKKISQIQMYKLQQKGVRNVIIMYDADAVEAIKKSLDMLGEYFYCYVADPINPEHDAGDMDFWEFWDTFTTRLYTAREYKINKLQV